MTKFLKISVPLVSLIFLLNMSSAGYAESTVSAEVGFIFNTTIFNVDSGLFYGLWICNVRVRYGYIKKCICNLCKI